MNCSLPRVEADFNVGNFEAGAVNTPGAILALTSDVRLIHPRKQAAVQKLAATRS
jgi:hypothetical protein